MNRLANMFATLMEDRRPRDQFKAPIYDGKSDVELFINQFNDIRAANEWNDATALLKLRATLLGQATECGRGGDPATVFAALRARFGLTVRQARDMLGGLRRDNRSSLHEHGVNVERLVRIAYPDMLVASRIDMSLDVFCRSLDNRNLQRHLLAVAPQNMDAAVRVAEEYLQVGTTSQPGDVRLRTVDHEEETLQAHAVQKVSSGEEAIQSALAEILRRVEQNSRAIVELGKLHHSQAKQGGQGKRESGSYPRRKLQCYGCGGEHMVKDCTQRPKTYLVQQDQGNETSSCQ